MSAVLFLGTSNAVSYKHHENSCLALLHGDETVLVDCPSSPMRQLAEAGLDPLVINNLVLTHFHPDHVGGVPIFLMNVWLKGRTQPLHLYAIDDCISRMKEMMKLYRWETWPGLFEVVFHRIPLVEQAPVLAYGTLDITASPVKHIIPTIGLSITASAGDYRIVYTSDTEPCEAVVRMAKNADVLIHEANGAIAGHSSAAQAGAAAASAGVNLLVLTHYPEDSSEEHLIAEAESMYSGEVRVARDLEIIRF